MSFFKKIGKSVGQAVRKLVDKPVIAPKAPRLPRPEIPSPPVSGDPATIARDAFRDIGKSIVGTAETIRDGAGAAVETAGEFIDDTDHFMKTGDWNRAVEKLQGTEADAEAKMWMARAAFDDALRIYVQTAVKRRSLSLLHEGDAVDRPERIAVPETREVEPDLYGSPGTRVLDKIGLDTVGDAGRAVQKIVPFRLPHSLLLQQAELAEARKLLSDNIRAFRSATAAVNKATADIIGATDSVAHEVEALEDDFIRRGVDPETGATRDMAEKTEAQSRRGIARDLLSAGLPIEDVARATELELAEIEALKDAA
ncbi:hypothetical protein [Roseovarius sp. D22-M7]|uniref:hypothetical protein n=1 Tax=Roseovarius sp. D22-M7 TaxID=3127116 RepID=UPI0030106103